MRVWSEDLESLCRRGLVLGPEDLEGRGDEDGGGAEGMEIEKNYGERTDRECGELTLLRERGDTDTTPLTQRCDIVSLALQDTTGFDE